jgi:hypothetical protein
MGVVREPNATSDTKFQALNAIGYANSIETNAIPAAPVQSAKPGLTLVRGSAAQFTAKPAQPMESATNETTSLKS